MFSVLLTPFQNISLKSKSSIVPDKTSVEGICQTLHEHFAHKVKLDHLENQLKSMS